MRRLEATSVMNFKVYIHDWSYRALDTCLKCYWTYTHACLVYFFKSYTTVNKSGGS